MNGTLSYLAISGVTKRFQENAGVFDIHLEVTQGEAVCLLGPSGCGKTTLLRIVAGLLAPDSGTVRLAQNDITNSPPHVRDMGMVFQTWALFPHLSVRRNVEFGLEMRRANATARQAQADKMLDLVGLSGFGERSPKELSGGQQQRVALARALAINPTVLLLDEPLSSLDFNTRVELRRELRLLQQELGVTAIHVTHDYSEALAIADRTVLMNNGRIVEQGPTARLFARPATAHGARFLGLHNLIGGRFVCADSDIAEVEVCGGHRARITLATDTDRNLFRAGAPVLLCFDQWSAALLGTPPSDATTAIPVRIQGSVVEHGYTQISLVLEGGEDIVHVRRPGIDHVQVGAAAFLAVNWSKAWPLAAPQNVTTQ